jgi:hypothetical protein
MFFFYIFFIKWDTCNLLIEYDMVTRLKINRKVNIMIHMIRACLSNSSQNNYRKSINFYFNYCFSLIDYLFLLSILFKYFCSFISLSLSLSLIVATSPPWPHQSSLPQFHHHPRPKGPAVQPHRWRERERGRGRDHESERERRSRE